MKKQFATYEIALKLKELGFNESCLGYFNQMGYLQFALFEDGLSNIDSDFYIDAPLWQQVIDWLREKYDFHIDITIAYPKSYNIGIYNMNKRYYSIYDVYYNGYEEAREQAILKAIELCKNN